MGILRNTLPVRGTFTFPGGSQSAFSSNLQVKWKRGEGSPPRYAFSAIQLKKGQQLLQLTNRYQSLCTGRQQVVLHFCVPRILGHDWKGDGQTSFLIVTALLTNRSTVAAWSQTLQTDFFFPGHCESALWHRVSVLILSYVMGNEYDSYLQTKVRVILQLFTMMK